jgi:RNA polymerase sporulation-specific sigma factor
VKSGLFLKMKIIGFLIKINIYRFVIAGEYMALFKVEICGVNTSKLPLLTEDEKKELFKEIKKGNEVAREKYIRGNLRLVLSILQRFSNSNENVDDLFQIGCIGLIKAVDNFDDTLNVKFSTYAVPMISGELKRYLRDNAAIRVSRSIKDIAYKAIYCKENIIKTTHREPTVVEIAKEIGVEPEDVVYALDAIQSPVSLYDPVYDQGGDTLYVMDQISDKKNKEEKWVENIALNEALKGLSERERKIIDMRFFNGKTQMEIADEIGISQAQVSRLEKNALKAMKKYME